jgi:predicted XRE-type DNA-binding protein
VTATDKSHEECVEEIEKNGQIKQKDTAFKLGISKERMGHIINLLGIQKFSARWAK